EDDNVGLLHDKLSEVGANLLLETIPPLFDGKLKPIRQDEEKATFAPNIKREQEKIDWCKSDLDIYNQIRGLNPWSVAFTTNQNKKQKIWRARRRQSAYAGTPGPILAKNKAGLILQCGNKTSIKLPEIEPAGKKRMAVRQYLLRSDDRIKVRVKLGV